MRGLLLGGAALSLWCGLARADEEPLDPPPKPDLSAGFGVRTSFRAQQHAAPGGATSKDPELESARLYLAGKLDPHFSATLDLDFTTLSDSTGRDVQPVRVLDAIAELRVAEELHVWAGRLLPPSDRANLNGPYFQLGWDYPFVSAYPSIYGGRDNGLAIWGDIAKGLFKYQVGAFQGRSGAPNDGDQLMYAGRLQLDLLDAEPGYYTQDTYHGKKDVLAVGFAMQGQKDGAGVAGQPRSFVGFSVDALFDYRLPADLVLTLEATLHHYDSARSAAEMKTGPDGTGVLAQGGLLLPTLGWGRLQPVVRYQHLAPQSRWEAGLNYVLKGHLARVSAHYYHLEDDAAARGAHGVILGAQIQVL